MFNPVASYGYLLSDMYLFMADITNPAFLVQGCRTWIGLDITRFCEQQRQPSSGSACAQKTVNRAPIAEGRGGSTQFAQQLESAVTAPPLVGCVVWSMHTSLFVLPLVVLFLCPGPAVGLVVCVGVVQFVLQNNFFTDMNNNLKKYILFYNNLIA